MRLVFMRHGETEWNREKRLQGQADAPLSARGRAQAEAMRPIFANGLSPDYVVASDLPRARDTAALIGFPEAKLDPRLREIHVGDWTAKLIADLKAMDDAAYRGWRAGTFTPQGGETWAAFKARIHDAIEDLVASGRPSALIVAHGGVIRAACEVLIDLPPARILPVGPASLTIFDVELSAGHLIARLEGFNLTPANPHLGAPD